MTTQTTTIREFALAALREHEDEEALRRLEQRALSEVRLTTLIAERLGIDLEGASIEWRPLGRGKVQPSVTVEGVRYTLDDHDSLCAAIAREDCDHEVWDVIGEMRPWVQLGDLIRSAEKLAAEPCRQCARQASADASAPEPSLGERLDALIREIVHDWYDREIPF